MKYIILFIVFTVFSGCANKEEEKISAQATPLEKLIEGNKQFVKMHAVNSVNNRENLSELKKGQHPFAVVVGCSDSRVDPQLIFDQWLGNIFSIRTAGNVIGDYELGSIEYAVEHLGCKLIIVLGHENCGAVDAYINHNESSTGSHIDKIIEYIAAEEEEKALPDNQKKEIVSAVKANILHGVNLLKSSEPVLKKLFDENKIEIIGATYDLDNGEVAFFEEKK